MFTQLVRAGVDGVRLSFSHGTQDQHRAEAAMVRKVAAQEGRQIAMLADLCGPKIRVGKFVEGQIDLEVGQTFTLTSEDVPGTDDRASMSYPLANDLKKGDIMLLDDGLLRLRVTAFRPPRSKRSSKWAARFRTIKASTCLQRSCKSPQSPTKIARISKSPRKSASITSRCRSFVGL